MTKKYLLSKRRFASHLDNKIEQVFEKNIKSSFEEYFLTNPQDLTEDFVEKIKHSMVQALYENIDFSIERLQSGEVKNNVTIRDAVDTIIIEEEHLETSKKSRQRHKKKEEEEEEIPKKISTIRKRK